MKGLAESSPFHLLTNFHVINRFIFGHGLVIYYTIRLKFSNFFIHHHFQNQMFENFTYAFNISSDAQIHVS